MSSFYDPYPKKQIFAQTFLYFRKFWMYMATNIIGTNSNILLYYKTSL